MYTNQFDYSYHLQNMIQQPQKIYIKLWTISCVLCVIGGEMTTICLNMIVKDEAHVIENTLKSILSYIPIDYWVICDTGSQDTTRELIQTFFDKCEIPGELIEHDWVNFGYNRQLALEAAQGKTDYVFFFDADDHIEGHLLLPELTERCYYFLIKDEEGATVYHRPLLVKNDGTYYWRSVLHEFIVDSKGEGYTIIEGDYLVRSCRTGGRSFDPNKYRNDALVLEKALEQEVDPDLKDRYIFYAGQSWAAAGETERSIYWYKKRTEQQGWDQELYVAHCRLAGLYGDDNPEVAIFHLLCATEVFPKRAEAWYQLSRLNSWKGRHSVAYSFALRAAEAVEKYDRDYLFKEGDIYQYWSHYELFINAFYAQELQTSYTAFKQLVYREAPSWLFLNEPDKLQAFRRMIQEDKYQEVIKLRQALMKINATQVLTVLEIYE